MDSRKVLMCVSVLYKKPPVVYENQINARPGHHPARWKVCDNKLDVSQNEKSSDSMLTSGYSKQEALL